MGANENCGEQGGIWAIGREGGMGGVRSCHLGGYRSNCPYFLTYKRKQSIRLMLWDYAHREQLVFVSEIFTSSCQPDVCKYSCYHNWYSGEDQKFVESLEYKASMKESTNVCPQPAYRVSLGEAVLITPISQANLFFVQLFLKNGDNLYHLTLQA